MKVLVENAGEAIEFSREAQRIINRIGTSSLHDIEKTSFEIFLSKIRDAVVIEEAKNEGR
jgi:hypothetical protein